MQGKSPYGTVCSSCRRGALGTPRLRVVAGFQCARGLCLPARCPVQDGSVRALLLGSKPAGSQPVWPARLQHRASRGSSLSDCIQMQTGPALAKINVCTGCCSGLSEYKPSEQQPPLSHGETLPFLSGDSLTSGGLGNSSAPPGGTQRSAAVAAVAAFPRLQHSGAVLPRRAQEGLPAALPQTCTAIRKYASIEAVLAPQYRRGGSFLQTKSASFPCGCGPSSVLRACRKPGRSFPLLMGLGCEQEKGQAGGDRHKFIPYRAQHSSTPDKSCLTAFKNSTQRGCKERGRSWGKPEGQPVPCGTQLRRHLVLFSLRAPDRH